MTRNWVRWAGIVLLVAGFSGCHQGKTANPFGLRGRSNVPYIVERPALEDQQGRDRLHLSGYAGFNYGAPPIVAPIIRRAP